jgi:hypothetical protein
MIEYKPLSQGFPEVSQHLRPAFALFDQADRHASASAHASLAQLAKGIRKPCRADWAG